ncbi:hypothetical protein D9756_004592 [Leucocoprinus leucothites]|uniref:DUF427 domain-containing protein n=1 Tax=Leucocoprinus leucothites TaxID=201217 RepID=A0A8H5G9D2_9AGAR|nr:hypothetical protein D9756_004592 [Leucoagaricus leucothites]
MRTRGKIKGRTTYKFSCSSESGPLAHCVFLTPSPNIMTSLGFTKLTEILPPPFHELFTNLELARMTVKVTLNGQVLAESDDTIVVEGNHYFPPDAVKKADFTDSGTHTTCPWKGEASYYNTSVGGDQVKDVAWYYPKTITAKAKPIEGYVAFYKSKVQIEQD